MELVLDRSDCKLLTFLQERYGGQKTAIERGVFTYQRGHNGPQIVVCPAKPHDDEQLPLIPPHPDFLDLGAISI